MVCPVPFADNESIWKEHGEVEVKLEEVEGSQTDQYTRRVCVCVVMPRVYNFDVVAQL